MGEVGFQNGEIEQPGMYSLVPKNLKGKKPLDLGCGPGIHAKTYVKRGAHVTGIDLSPEMVRLAQQYCLEAHFEQGNIERLRFKKNSFDVVTCSLALDHLKDLKPAIKGIKRVLKPKGLLVFSLSHPFLYVFQDWNVDGGKITRSYFDTTKFYFTMANNPQQIPEYPRTLDAYMQPFLDVGFELVHFVENRPQEQWKQHYNGFDNAFFLLSFMCFFVWRKIA